MVAAAASRDLTGDQLAAVLDEVESTELEAKLSEWSGAGTGLRVGAGGNNAGAGKAAKARFLSLYRHAATLEAAALEADQALAELPDIDVLVLGMGDDGHTASLFPNSPKLSEGLDPSSARRCLPMLAPSVPHQRLSMTRALLATAGFTALSVQGPGKLATLRAALGGDDLAEMPIRAFLQDPLDIYWCP